MIFVTFISYLCFFSSCPFWCNCLFKKKRQWTIYIYIYCWYKIITKQTRNICEGKISLRGNVCDKASFFVQTVSFRALIVTPKGPNSGILVIQDEESEATCFFGLFKSHEIRDLPFPYNKNLKLRYTTRNGEHRHVYHFYATFVTVLNQPLSSNRYYAVKTRGSHKGYAFLCFFFFFDMALFSCSYSCLVDHLWHHTQVWSLHFGSQKQFCDMKSKLSHLHELH